METWPKATRHPAIPLRKLPKRDENTRSHKDMRAGTHSSISQDCQKKKNDNHPDVYLLVEKETKHLLATQWNIM